MHNQQIAHGFRKTQSCEPRHEPMSSAWQTIGHHGFLTTNTRYLWKMITMLRHFVLPRDIKSYVRKYAPTLQVCVIDKNLLTFLLSTYDMTFTYRTSMNNLLRNRILSRHYRYVIHVLVIWWHRSTYFRTRIESINKSTDIN